MPKRNRVAIRCAQCGREFETIQWKIDHHANLFCDRKCKGEWTKAHPRKQVIVKCNHCQKEIIRRRYQIEEGRHYYCNPRCMSEHFKTLTGPDAPRYKKATIQCDTCSKEIERAPAEIKKKTKHFCSQECRLADATKGAVEYECEICGAKIIRKQWEVTKGTHRFCGRKCSAIWHAYTHVGPNSPAWRGGRTRYYGENWLRQSRAARKRDNYTCQVCGKHQDENKKLLDVHHIIPFREFMYVPGENENYTAANALSNLITLCPDCHKKAESGKISV